LTRRPAQCWKTPSRARTPTDFGPVKRDRSCGCPQIVTRPQSRRPRRPARGTVRVRLGQGFFEAYQSSIDRANVSGSPSIFSILWGVERNSRLCGAAIPGSRQTISGQRLQAAESFCVPNWRKSSKGTLPSTKLNPRHRHRAQRRDYVYDAASTAAGPEPFCWGVRSPNVNRRGKISDPAKEPCTHHDRYRRNVVLPRPSTRGVTRTTASLYLDRERQDRPAGWLGLTLPCRA
jgi:hypothetical protein